MEMIAAILSAIAGNVAINTEKNSFFEVHVPGEHCHGSLFVRTVTGNVLRILSDPTQKPGRIIIQQVSGFELDAAAAADLENSHGPLGEIEEGPDDDESSVPA